MLPNILAEVSTVVAPPPLTRPVFGNVPPWAITAFYLLSAVAIAVWAFGLVSRVRLWRKGRQFGKCIDWKQAGSRLLHDVLLQQRIWGRGRASIAHFLLFGGFVVLFIGTTLISIEHILAAILGRDPSDPVFHRGVYYAVFELMMDVAGIALLIGCCLFLVRRLRGQGSFGRAPSDIVNLSALIGIGITGYLIEGLRIIHAGTPLPGLSPVGFAFAKLFTSAGITATSAGAPHLAMWWLHAFLVLAFIASMPYSRLLHTMAGAINLATRDHQLGVMNPISIEEVEATGRIGAASLADFNYHQLIELDACVSCGRCEDGCPAFEAGKPLSPRNVVQDIRGVLSRSEFDTNLHEQTVSADTLWSCTTCGACADICPLGVSPMRMITDLRRHLVGEGALRGSPAAALQKTDRVGNPWGLPAADRMAWAAGLNVPLARDNRQFELLYWVGCAAAYDRRVQKVARAFVRLLQAANINFAVLGPEERCTGESARRMGDELLFQQLAEQNVTKLSERRVQKIVAHCPHCVNSLANDYPQMGGNFEVIHHSEFLAELIAQQRIKVDPQLASAHSSTTFHDPCYLARARGVTQAPRAVLASAQDGAGQLPIIELPRHGRQTSCCGGGGGRMWFDDALAQRVGQSRVQEIAAGGASKLAVACPFCLIMLGDGLAAAAPEVEVRDIAEVLADAVLGPERSADAVPSK